jgi:hypothetical protein
MVVADGLHPIAEFGISRLVRKIESTGPIARQCQKAKCRSRLTDLLITDY